MIRVNAQLIKVADDFHLWSDSFDRELSSVFEVQDEISQSIAGTLEMKLTPDEQKTLRYMKISPRKKLEWLHQMKEFLSHSSSKKTIIKLRRQG